MSTNLNQEYVTHDHIRRRMRWLFMLIVILGVSLFFAYAVNNDTTLKDFMQSPFNNSAMPMEGLSPSNTAAEKRSDINRTAITLWDERQPKGNDVSGHFPKLHNEVTQNTCATCPPVLIERSSLVEGDTNRGT